MQRKKGSKRIEMMDTGPPGLRAVVGRGPAFSKTPEIRWEQSTIASAVNSEPPRAFVRQVLHRIAVKS